MRYLTALLYLLIIPSINAQSYKPVLIITDTYRESFTYDLTGQLLQDLRENKTGQDTFKNASRGNYTYDNNGNEIIYLYEVWNDSSNSWEIDIRRSRTYDDQGRILTDLTEINRDGFYSLYESYSNSYNADGSKAEEIYERWDSPKKKTNWKYDSYGHVLLESVSMWYNKWMESSQIIYENDSFGKRISKLYQYFEQNVWVNGLQTIYRYDNLGYLVLDSTNNWNNETWAPWNVYWYTNDNAGNKLEEVYGSIRGSFGLLERKTHSYDSDGRELSFLGEQFFSGSWVNKIRSNTSYNALGQLITFHEEEYSLDGWRNTKIFTYTYDNEGNRISVTDQQWIGGYPHYNGSEEYHFDDHGNVIHGEAIQVVNGVWEPAYKMFTCYYNHTNDSILAGCKMFDLQYILFTEMKEYISDIKDFYLLQNYPNPFNPSTTISFYIPKREFVSLKVYNILGKEIAALINEEKPQGIYNIKFNARDLPSAVYFYKIQAGAFTETKKLILCK